MTSPSPSQHHHENKSRFQPTVCLADWWLIRAENDFQGRRLAVAGYTSREKQALRVFSSAPILKRYDVLTLETSDGICVILNGFMNKARTMENRFPSEVCDHFVFGFPPYWKDYDEKFISSDSSSGNMLGVDPVKKLSPQSKGAAAAEQMSEAKEYETPDPGKAEVCDTSNKFLGFSRSRSGRLLVPPLKFWCNQRAIYDLDRTVTGIQECLPVEEPRKGSRSKPSR